jgi:hypothetical protein
MFAVVITIFSGFAAAAAAGKPRPLKGWAFESLSAPPVLIGVDVFLVADGGGQLTHLGNFTRHAEVLLHPDDSFDGEVFFTAANGDVLRADLHGNLGSDGLLTGFYTFTAEGSTGRFADVIGSAHFTGPFDGSSAFLSIDGEIEY